MEQKTSVRLTGPRAPLLEHSNPKTVADLQSSVFRHPWATCMRVTVADLRYLLMVAKGLKRPMYADTLIELLANRKFDP